MYLCSQALQDSLKIEWYYRSLVPKLHYVPFTVQSLTKARGPGHRQQAVCCSGAQNTLFRWMQVLQRVRTYPEPRVRKLTTEANRFAYSYLGHHSRVVYWAAAITR